MQKVFKKVRFWHFNNTQEITIIFNKVVTKIRFTEE